MLRPPRSVTAAHRRQLDRIRSRASAAVVARWSTSDLDEIVQIVLSGQRAMIAATDAGLSLASGITTRTATTPIGIDPEPLIGAAARNGTSLEGVYSRPHRVIREDGLARGLAYLRATARTDMQLAHRQAAHAHAVADSRVRAWRRTPGGMAPCGLCIVAAMRTYRRGDILPLHNACACDVSEVYTDQRIAQGDWVDRDALQAVYDAAGSTSYDDLIGVRFDVTGDLPVPLSDAQVAELKSLNVRVVRDPELGPRLEGERHDTTFGLPA